MRALILAVTVASLAGCSTARYKTEPIVRTGTVRMPTLRQMESLNMDREAPIFIRIYKEENTLEIWKQDRTGKFALLKSFQFANFQANSGQKLSKEITKRLKDFMTLHPSK